MGGEERIALGHETDPRTDPEPARDRRRGRERGEAVGELGVGAGELAIRGERIARLVVDRHDRVLGHPERLEAALLACAGQVGDR